MRLPATLPVNLTLKNIYIKNKEKKSGFEPATFGLQIRCSYHCATKTLLLVRLGLTHLAEETFSYLTEVGQTKLLTKSVTNVHTDELK